MTLGTINLYIAIVALVLTAILKLVVKKENSWLMTFLQTFSGAFFVFSGAVKAIDPLGTAYKMQQYFAAFETTFDATWFSFLSPLFPWLETVATPFSVIVITFEIALGIMLLIGYKRKITSRLFMALVVFFLFLTGFTYLTGYVPNQPVVMMTDVDGKTVQVISENVDTKIDKGWKVSGDTVDVEFFNFGYWGSFVETNQKVTDCGCFGDFLKLEPKISFLKDVFLLIPAFFFLFGWRNMYQVLNEKKRMYITLGITLITFLFCYRNYGLNLPIADFRPFKEGVNIRETKKAEEDAAGNVQIIEYRLKNTKTGKTVVIPADQYTNEIGNYPEADGWDRELLERIQTEPAIPSTKISEFGVYGNAVVENFLFTIDGGSEDDVIPFESAADTVGAYENGFRFKEIGKEVQEGIDISNTLLSDPNYSFMIVSHKPKISNKKAFSEKVNALHKAAEGKGLNFYAIAGGVDQEDADAFKATIGATYPFYTADDILLKTILRSNPGIVLLKNGEIIKKWHHRKLPNFVTIEEKYMK